MPLTVLPEMMFRDSVLVTPDPGAHRVQIDQQAAGVAQCLGAGEVGANPIAFDDILHQALIDFHARQEIARNEITGSRRGSTNDIATRIDNQHP